MSRPTVKSLELSMESTGQTDEENIEVLMKLGLSRRRSLFIVKRRDAKAEGSAVQATPGERQRQGILEHS